MSILKSATIIILLISSSLPCLAGEVSRNYADGSYVASQSSSAVFICSKFKDVDIYIDEDNAGRTPAVFANLAKGKHLIEAYNGEELIYRQYMIVKSGEKIIINISGEKNIAEEDLKFII